MYESIGRYQKQVSISQARKSDDADKKRVGALTKQNKCLEYLGPSSKVSAELSNTDNYILLMNFS